MLPLWPDVISAISDLATAVFTAVGAIAIPIVLHYRLKVQNEQMARREIETRTLQEVDELNRRVSTDVREIMKRASRNELTYEKISNDADLEYFVFDLLNQYEYLCLGVNKSLFSKEIFMDMRGNALRTTRCDYSDHIDKYRMANRKEAWTEIDKLLHSLSNSNDRRS